jgi:hypothetical protein
VALYKCSAKRFALSIQELHSGEIPDDGLLGLDLVTVAIAVRAHRQRHCRIEDRIQIPEGRTRNARVFAPIQGNPMNAADRPHGRGSADNDLNQHAWQRPLQTERQIEDRIQIPEGRTRNVRENGREGSEERPFRFDRKSPPLLTSPVLARLRALQGMSMLLGFGQEVESHERSRCPSHCPSTGQPKT